MKNVAFLTISGMMQICKNKSIKKILDILVKNFDLLFKDKSLILTKFAMLYKEN